MDGKLEADGLQGEMVMQNGKCFSGDHRNNGKVTAEDCDETDELSGSRTNR